MRSPEWFLGYFESRKKAVSLLRNAGRSVFWTVDGKQRVVVSKDLKQLAEASGGPRGQSSPCISTAISSKTWKT